MRLDHVNRTSRLLFPLMLCQPLLATEAQIYVDRLAPSACPSPELLRVFTC